MSGRPLEFCSSIADEERMRWAPFANEITHTAVFVDCQAKQPQQKRWVVNARAARRVSHAPVTFYRAIC
jgi:hypothetical protein